MSNKNIKEIKDIDGSVKVRVEKFAVISSAPSIEDLVKRIEALEKQLASMQLTSCDFQVLRKMTSDNFAYAVSRLKYSASRS